MERSKEGDMNPLKVEILEEVEEPSLSRARGYHHRFVGDLTSCEVLGDLIRQGWTVDGCYEEDGRMWMKLVKRG